MELGAAPGVAWVTHTTEVKYWGLVIVKYRSELERKQNYIIWHFTLLMQGEKKIGVW